MKYENKKTFKEILNDTVTDTALVVRDINLSKDLEERYIPGTIILERGFTDASYKVGGMLTSHRYAIITNKIKVYPNLSMVLTGGWLLQILIRIIWS